MVITFIGHGTLLINSELTKKLIYAIKASVADSNSVSFYCGRYGNFDNHCALVCHKLKSEIPNSEVVYITPYLTDSHQEKIKFLKDSKIYDTSIYPPIEKTPPRFAISKRNEWMVLQADVIIAYVDRNYGGAYKALEYARRKKKHIINLAEEAFCF